MAGRNILLNIICVLILCVWEASCATTTAVAGRQLPNTNDDVHFFLVFDTPILNQWFQGVNTSVADYDFIWGASSALIPMYRHYNPNIVLSQYIPFSRDPDNRDLSWWKARNPDWIVYQCDKVTPAKLSTDPHIVLDISNPDVIAWQVANYAAGANAIGYDAIAADNFALGNAMSACGIWKGNVWVPKYTGDWWDLVYIQDALNWLTSFKQKLSALSPPLLLGVNFVVGTEDFTTDMVSQVTTAADIIMDEAGFTNWGSSMPPVSQWLNIVNYIESLQTKNKGYYAINEFTVMNRAVKEYAVASYLMARTTKSAINVCLVQDYGIANSLPEYNALKIGHSTAGKTVNSKGVYTRAFSNGIVVVNPTAASVTFTLGGSASVIRVDIAGKQYGPTTSITMLKNSGLVLANKQ